MVVVAGVAVDIVVDFVYFVIVVFETDVAVADAGNAEVVVCVDETFLDGYSCLLVFVKIVVEDDTG